MNRYSPVLIIDICGTLYKSNTTFDFIKYHFGDSAQFKMINNFRRNRFVCNLNYMWFKLTGDDVMRRRLIKILKGESKDKLVSMAKDFYENYLLSHRNSQCFDIIEKYRNNGARLVLVSATLDIIAKTIAEYENVPEWVASNLSFDNDRCEGKIKNDLLKGKLEYTLRLTDNTHFDVITDNYSDGDIIKASSHSYLVQYSNKLNKWNRFIDKNTFKKCDFIII